MANRPRKPRAYRNGIKSYQNGYWLHQNPYRQRDNGNLHEKWRDGWLAAKARYADANDSQSAQK